ncbi:hypothetical protein MMC21_006295 [Puttea exsequens]|nr:hypothetical protein [Puttea exsequens]
MAWVNGGLEKLAGMAITSCQHVDCVADGGGVQDCLSKINAPVEAIVAENIIGYSFTCPPGFAYPEIHSCHTFAALSTIYGLLVHFFGLVGAFVGDISALIVSSFGILKAFFAAIEYCRHLNNLAIALGIIIIVAQSIALDTLPFWFSAIRVELEDLIDARADCSAIPEGDRQFCDGFEDKASRAISYCATTVSGFFAPVLSYLFERIPEAFVVALHQQYQLNILEVRQMQQAYLNLEALYHENFKSLEQKKKSLKAELRNAAAILVYSSIKLARSKEQEIQYQDEIKQLNDRISACEADKTRLASAAKASQAALTAQAEEGKNSLLRETEQLKASRSEVQKQMTKARKEQAIQDIFPEANHPETEAEAVSRRLAEEFSKLPQRGLADSIWAPKNTPSTSSLPASAPQPVPATNNAGPAPSSHQPPSTPNHAPASSAVDPPSTLPPHLKAPKPAPAEPAVEPSTPTPASSSNLSAAPADLTRAGSSSTFPPSPTPSSAPATPAIEPSPATPTPSNASNTMLRGRNGTYIPPSHGLWRTHPATPNNAPPPAQQEQTPPREPDTRTTRGNGRRVPEPRPTPAGAMKRLEENMRKQR